MKATIADHASVLGGSLAGGVALIPVYAVRTNPSEREEAAGVRPIGGGQRGPRMTHARLSTGSSKGN